MRDEEDLGWTPLCEQSFGRTVIENHSSGRESVRKGELALKVAFSGRISTFPNMAPQVTDAFIHGKSG